MLYLGGRGNTRFAWTIDNDRLLSARGRLTLNLRLPCKLYLSTLDLTVTT
jgi:hypothetical protein